MYYSSYYPSLLGAQRHGDVFGGEAQRSEGAGGALGGQVRKGLHGEGGGVPGARPQQVGAPNMFMYTEKMKIFLLEKLKMNTCFYTEEYLFILNAH